MLDLVVSLEDVAAELEFAASDVAIEQQLPFQPAARAMEAVATLTDELFVGAEPSLAPTLGAGIKAGEEVAVIAELKNKVAELHREFTEWRKNVFRSAKDKLAAIAEQIVSTAKRLGVTTEHLITRLQRRITSTLVEGAICRPFQVGTDTDKVTFAASEVTVTSVVKTAPSLASMDVTGVVKLLSGLLTLELDVAVKYGTKP
ncbi:hypothetical protein [Streptomyces dangxiongensis]|uniref:hypothetical protein n=1 Tax=Streptomyces dangxiongensis TaxID=1442032 RepID=UPI0013CEAAE8|nr:hypothetical protein [Streptomyces dangxiongensis]